MKRLYYIVALAVFAAALFGVGYNAYAADAGTPSGTGGKVTSGTAIPDKYQTMYGFIVDTKCMSGKEAKMAEKEGKLDAFVKKHSKECVLACKSGGCGFYANGRLYKLDKESSRRVEEFLKNPDNDLHVKVDVYKVEKGTIGVTNIHNAI